MKYISCSLIFLLCLTGWSFGQAPNGINYQAVALDASGNPVNNQNVRLRLSVLQGSSAGPLLFAEEHYLTTDAGGHFSLVIGSGTNQTSSFASINWGNQHKWLKTEMDITGGTNFTLVGNSQFMSTPYALYANSAATAGSLELPDGIAGITPVALDYDSTYVVPSGKNCYVNYDLAYVDSIGFSNYALTTGITARRFIGASAGQTLRSDGAGFLVDATVQWISINLTCNAYTVPAGKILVITNQDVQGDVNFLLNGRQLNRNISLNVFKAGDLLSATGTCGINRYNVNGYLRNP